MIRHLQGRKAKTKCLLQCLPEQTHENRMGTATQTTTPSLCHQAELAGFLLFKSETEGVLARLSHHFCHTSKCFAALRCAQENCDGTNPIRMHESM